MAQNNVEMVQEYISGVNDKQAAAIKKLHETILKNLPDGYVSGIEYGMIYYSVPHDLYPEGYHVDPSKPLGLMALAAQKQYIALYHLGLYQNPKLLEWFRNAYERTGLNLDMGKSCIRFRNPSTIPYALIAELAAKLSVDEYVRQYNAARGSNTREGG